MFQWCEETVSAKPTPSKNASDRKPSTSPRKTTRRLLTLGLGLTGIAAISATAGALLAVSLSSTPLRQSDITAQEASVFSLKNAIAYRNLRLPELSRPVNILVLGVKVLTSDVADLPHQDLGYHALVNSFQGHTDSMLLVRLDPQKQKLTVLSIPRDTQVEFEEEGIKKINEANAIGGSALAAEKVSELLGGITIDRYLRINVQGVEKFIDALGGVTVYVPKDMKYNDFSQHLYIDLKEGEQHLDGDKAVQFLRYRYDQFGDIGRVQRQQAFMRALTEQALKPQTLLKLPDIIKVIQSHIDTNLSLEELLALAGFASKTQRADIQMLMLPGAFNGTGRHEVSYWLPDPEKIERLAAQYFDRGWGGYSDLDPKDVRIAIQNSTDNPEIATRMVHYLEEQGYRRIYMGDRPPQLLKTTRIIAQSGDDGSAAALRASLGVGEVLVESTGNLASDISIQIGEDWQEKLPQLDQL
jgi:LCP family protein required for cell wall assembly